MPTDLPRVFAEEHDYSAVDAYHSAVKAKAKARLILTMGLAALTAGAGVGAAAWGLSFLIEPKIIETEKVVVQEKVVTVDKPVITERVVTVEKPVVVEKPVALPSPPANAEEKFTQTEEFKTAQFKGRIKSIVGGEIVFDNGRKLVMADASGRPSGSPTTSKYDGDIAFCRYVGDYANGRKKWPCSVFHNGRSEALVFDKAGIDGKDQPFADLYN
jgi:hypothetical protein